MGAVLAARRHSGGHTKREAVEGPGVSDTYRGHVRAPLHPALLPRQKEGPVAVPFAPDLRRAPKGRGVSPRKCRATLQPSPRAPGTRPDRAIGGPFVLS